MIVADRLKALAEINKSRGNSYGDFKKLGRVLAAYFPEPMTIQGEEDWNRIALLIFSINKMVRYSVNFKNGGHKDSLDDAAVYAMMLQGMDEEPKK
jgi:hypothetical protein